MRNAKEQGSRGKIAWSPVKWEASLGVSVNYSIFLLVRDGTRTFCIKVPRKSYSPTLTVVFTALEKRCLVPADGVNSIKSLFCRPMSDVCACWRGGCYCRGRSAAFQDFLNTRQAHSWWWPNSFASLCSSCANGRREKCELCRSLRPEVTAGK